MRSTLRRISRRITRRARRDLQAPGDMLARLLGRAADQPAAGLSSRRADDFREARMRIDRIGQARGLDKGAAAARRAHQAAAAQLGERAPHGVAVDGESASRCRPRREGARRSATRPARLRARDRRRSAATMRRRRISGPRRFVQSRHVFPTAGAEASSKRHRGRASELSINIDNLAMESTFAQSRHGEIAGTAQADGRARAGDEGRDRRRARDDRRMRPRTRSCGRPKAGW